MEKKQAVVGDYIVTARIGSGSFAIVYKGYHKITNVPVAVKAINKTKLNPKLLENLESEISIMRQINHPNIVKLYEIKKTEKHIYLMLEYCEGGDLQHFIKKQSNGVVNQDTARHFLRKLADGLHVLWSLNLIHRDLKPQNLLLTESSPTASLKIADFGFARHLESTSLAETLCGSPLYMAPEILQFQKYDNKADLWSVGTILYEMVVGRPPFNGANQVQLLHNIQRESVRFPKDLVIGRDAISLIEGLLVRDPKFRISFEQFFNSPFLDRVAHTGTQLTPVTGNYQPMTAYEIPLVNSITSPVDIKASRAVDVPSPVLLHSAKLHDSYRNSMMQSYRRRSVSTSLKYPTISSSISSGSQQMPISPDLVPLTTPSLRTNPFKSDISSPQPSTLVAASTSAPAAMLKLPQTSFRMKQSVSTRKIEQVAPSSPVLFDCDMRVDAMLARVQAILNLIDIMMPVTMDPILTHSGSSVSSSTSSNSLLNSPVSSIVQEKGRPADALVLSMKCLHLLHMIVAQEDARSKRSWIKELLAQAIDKAEQCKKWLPSDINQLSSFEDIMYNQVMRLGREAAVQEVLGQKSLALELYNRAHLLLESILLSTKSIQHDDRQRLVSFVEAFRVRLQQCVS